MTNIVFIEHKQVPRVHQQAIKNELREYAISVALKFPTKTISDEHKIKIAKFSVKEVFKQFDLSTKNLSALIHDEVISNLQKLYFSLKQNVKKSNKEFLEMIRIVKLLRKKQPRKFKRLAKSLFNQLNGRQQLIFNLYFKFKPNRRNKHLTYKVVSKISKTSPSVITGDVKHVVHSLTKIMKAQKVKLNGRTK